MTSPKRVTVQSKLLESPEEAQGIAKLEPTELIEDPLREEHLKEISKLPRRQGPLYWTAFIFSLISLGILIAWLVISPAVVPLSWIFLDIGLSVFFAVEFFTRRGLHLNWKGYLFTRFFDFVAMVPALVLIYYQISTEGVWIWVILVARIIRSVDRFLGDGFIRRNTLALLEGFEEEITDRVIIRIIARIESELHQGSFSHGIAQTLEHNRTSILKRIRMFHPVEGLPANLAHIAGLDKVVERAEERTFDAILKVIDSPEVDQAVREAVDTTFITIKKQIGIRTWRQKMGIQR